MSDDTNTSLTQGEQLGDYVIGQLISIGEHSQTYEAVQTSVQRDVIVTALLTTLQNDPAYREGFLADVRTKAMIDQPVISSVLEAVDGEAHCFFAREKLPGDSLTQILNFGKSLSPLETVRIIRSIADGYLYLEEHHIATLPLTTDEIYLDSNLHCRIVNLAVAGEPDESTSRQDKELLGIHFADLLEPNLPGSTRTASLLAYMSERDREHPLTWEQIYDLSDEVERQLAETSSQPLIKSPTMKLKKNFPASLLIKLLGSVIGIALITWIAIAIANRKTPPEQRKLPDMVRIPAGKYPGPDGNQINVREFWIDAHEVTIGEYASFLDDFAALRPENRAVYEHENQPKEKVSHEPDDWANLLAAAKEGTQWNTLPVDLNYPVVGIDWWDAHAYAEWKGRRLPSREQWYAACSSSIDPAKLEGTGWLAVDHAEHTPHGVYGLAGNVSEWTRERSLNPADLSQPKRHVLCGASYLKRKHGAMAREWVNDRNVRRPDLGFRTLTLSPQSE